MLAVEDDMADSYSICFGFPTIVPTRTPVIAREVRTRVNGVTIATENYDPRSRVMAHRSFDVGDVVEVSLVDIGQNGVRSDRGPALTYTVADDGGFVAGLGDYRLPDESGFHPD